MDAVAKKFNSNTKKSSAQASNPTKQDNKSNKARKEVDEYKKQLEAAMKRINDLADKEETYQVFSGNDTIEWLNFQHIPKR